MFDPHNIYKCPRPPARHFSQSSSLNHLIAISQSFPLGGEKMKRSRKFGLNLNFSYRHTGEDTDNIFEKIGFPPLTPTGEVSKYIHILISQKWV